MFTVIGERINTTLKKVKAAVEVRDDGYIREDVRKQTEAGATYIDVNGGARIGHEEEDMRWLLEVVQEATELPLCLDSPDPAVLEMAYGLVKKKPMINSISLEKDRFEPMINYLQGKECRIIALCMDDSGMPKTVDDIVSRAVSLVAELEKIGFARDDIFIDPLIQPMSVDVTNGQTAMEAIKRIMTELEGVHTTGGLSNISYGLPQRRIINRCFLAMMISHGFDSAIMDPLDRDIMAMTVTADMLAGNDQFCMNYIKAVRAEKIVA
ncbi:methyltetrahydrofolate--corrinoid methyltransferase [Desulfomarina profundi]|uniref:Methyltetrahydrofolate--corrinoid methyltransferase n=1 Tax=Desulfomarina profundi TaxID=2772557 RepID=A0A8D5FPW7_9BACT|nr:methyltetrahydrofolate--corrinoid methyltransferase [Desulfomarina profundi]